jgi:transposase
MADKLIVGIDISKDWLDLCASNAAGVERIANTPEVVAAWLERVGAGLIAFEPTGGYERTLIAAARERGIAFVRVHPNDVVAFRKSRGIKAKTDAIDARLILAFVCDKAARAELRTSLIGDDRLRALAARRRQLADALQAERCRLDAAALPAVRASLEAVIAVLRHSLGVLEAELADAVAAHPQTAELAKLLQTIFGIGPVVAITVIADLPELGLLSAKQIAALVGLAPHTKRSGKTRYRETTGHGRPGVRRVLFNAARTAVRHPSLFKDFYDRLVTDNRRPGKVALTAVMRKILITANAVARDHEPWHGRLAAGTPCRPHAEQTDHRAGRVKAAAARRAVARSASLCVGHVRQFWG